MLVRQLEEEVVKTRQHAKETNPEIKAHIEGLQLENDHLTREVAILKETIKVSPIPTICLITLIPSKVGIITLGMWYKPWISVLTGFTARTDFWHFLYRWKYQNMVLLSFEHLQKIRIVPSEGCGSKMNRLCPFQFWTSKGSGSPNSGLRIELRLAG